MLPTGSDRIRKMLARLLCDPKHGDSVQAQAQALALPGPASQDYFLPVIAS
ncbi:hypothetical protein ACSFA8_26190 [Variovorax sp. RT4R15]|uniref:hypothetical protein n=1 Tax=Variovorax sp. RT4R15 TaxID=3443737 RepID=UPI003F46F069